MSECCYITLIKLTSYLVIVYSLKCKFVTLIVFLYLSPSQITNGLKVIFDSEKNWLLDSSITLKTRVNPFPYDTIFEKVSNYFIGNQLNKFIYLSMCHYFPQIITGKYRIIFINAYDICAVNILCEVSNKYIIIT